MRGGTVVGAIFVLALVGVVGALDVWVGEEIVQSVMGRGLGRVGPVAALAAVFLVPFNAMAIGAVWAMVSWIDYLRKRPRAGGVLVIEGPGVMRVRIAHTHPIAAGLSWAGLMGFLGPIGIGCATGMDPSMTTVVVMAGLTVAAGVGGAVAWWRWQERLDKYVTIGGEPAMVGLPRIRVPVRVSEEGVPAASVEDVRSRQVGREDSTERVVTFFVREGGKRREIDVGVALGEERREALAEFLRERIGECVKRQVCGRRAGCE